MVEFPTLKPPYNLQLKIIIYFDLFSTANCSPSASFFVALHLLTGYNFLLVKCFFIWSKLIVLLNLGSGIVLMCLIIYKNPFRFVFLCKR